MIFELKDAIYKKEDISKFNPDIQTCLTLTKLFGLDLSESKKVKNLIPYLFYIDPQHYIYLLYYVISEKKTISYIKIPKRISEDKLEVDLQAQKFLGWSDKEVKKSQKVFDLVLEDKKYWKKEFGL